MKIADRLLTVAVTATLTSAAWVVAGPAYFGPDASLGLRGARGADAAPGLVPPTPGASGAHWPANIPAGQDESRALVVPVLDMSRASLVDSYRDARAEGARVHEAIDLMAPAGTPVVAAAPGKVERLFASEEGGTTIYLRSADRRTIYYYAHLQGYAPGLAEGQQVARGEVLAAVGSTGNADPAAPHLHFAILRTTPGAQWWEPGTPLNPFALLRRN